MAFIALKPNAVGDVEEIPTQYPASGEHWDKVDDGGSYVGPTDGDTTYVQNDGAAPANYKKDLYHMEALPVDALTITYVTIGVRVRKTGVSTYSYYQIRGKTNGVEFTPGISIPPTDQSWETGQFNYGTNPVTGNAWTVDEVNALQVGVSLYSDGSVFTRCTQVYVEVSYTVPPVSAPHAFFIPKIILIQ